jgi:hypothetical protein
MPVDEVSPCGTVKSKKIAKHFDIDDEAEW